MFSSDIRHIFFIDYYLFTDQRSFIFDVPGYVMIPKNDPESVRGNGMICWYKTPLNLRIHFNFTSEERWKIHLLEHDSKALFLPGFYLREKIAVFIVFYDIFARCILLLFSVFFSSQMYPFVPSPISEITGSSWRWIHGSAQVYRAWPEFTW